MLHIGVVFVVFGVFLVGAGLIPDDAAAMNAWSIFAKDSWWNELVLTGLFAMGLGIFLIILNSVISKKEDDDLEAYVQSQLTRSRSGNLIHLRHRNAIDWLLSPRRPSIGAGRRNGRPSNPPHQTRSANSTRMRRARLRRLIQFKPTTHAHQLRNPNADDLGICVRW